MYIILPSMNVFYHPVSLCYFFKTSSTLRPQTTPTHYFYFPTISMGQSRSCLLIGSYNCCSQLLGVDGHNWNFENCLIYKRNFENCLIYEWLFVISEQFMKHQIIRMLPPIFSSHWFFQISFFNLKAVSFSFFKRCNIYKKRQGKESVGKSMTPFSKTF